MSAGPELLLDDPWTVSATDFPHAAAAADQLRFLVNYAVLAPSILNTQPWRFRIAGDMIGLRAESALRLPVADPDGRELMISCGAALLNLTVAMRGFGHAASVAMLPDRDRTSLLAQVRIGDLGPVSDEDRELRDAIPKRHTFRGVFEPREVAPSLLETLARTAQQEGAAVSFHTDPAVKRRVAELVANAERSHLANPAFRQELAGWLRARAAEAETARQEVQWRFEAAGHTPNAKDDSGLFTAVAASVARSFASAQDAAAHQFARTEQAPAIALLSTRGDTPKEWLLAGMAMQRVLLAAAVRGAFASFLNPPVELAEFRPRLAEALGTTDKPQVLLRLGHAEGAAPTLRRPVREVVDSG